MRYSSAAAQVSRKEVAFVVKLQQNRGMLKQIRHITASLMLVEIQVSDWSTLVVIFIIYRSQI